MRYSIIRMQDFFFFFLSKERMQDLVNLIYSLKIATSTTAHWYIDITASLYISKKKN